MSQDVTSTNAGLHLKGKYELGLTTRVDGFRRYDTPDLKGFYHYIGIARLQIGQNVYRDHYLHLFGDYIFRLTDHPELGTDIHGFTTGVQYSWKMLQLFGETWWLKRPKKTYMIRVYPELFITAGLSNISSGYRLKSWAQGKGLFPYYEYGLALNVYLSKSWGFQLVALMPYHPHFKNLPYNGQTLAFKLIYKI